MRFYILMTITIAGLLSCKGEDTAQEDSAQNAHQEVSPVEETVEEETCLEIGCIAPNIQMQGRDGEIRNLKDLRGSVVLIDFWASWCKPCRMENPNLVRTYHKFKDQGFDVFSVSLDEDIGRWKQAIFQDGLEWDNHVCDFKAWQTPMTNLYQFNGIPHTVLLDREGRIVATKLRGQALELKVGELLGGDTTNQESI